MQPGPGDFIARRRKRRQERQDKRSEARRQQKPQGKGGQQPGKSSIDKWRQNPIVGGLIPLSSTGKYACPPLVVAGRAAVSLSACGRLETTILDTDQIEAPALVL